MAGPPAAVDEFASRIRMVFGDQVGDESTDTEVTRGGHEVRRYMTVILPEAPNAG